MGKHSERTAERKPWRRRAAIVAAVGLAGASVIGIAGASPTTSTTDVAFVPLTPVHKVFGGSVAANGSKSVVVSGGSTTVPTNATTVQLSITVTGPKAGSLSFYPAGDVAGGSGQTLSWDANHSNSATIAENIGMKNEVTIANSSAGAATVTATVTGYSTQVTAGDINGTGGNAGDVLTDNGAGGATWQPAGSAFDFSAVVSSPIFHVYIQPVFTTAIPAGNLYVNLSVEIVDSGVATARIDCNLRSPDGTVIDDESTSVSTATPQTTLSLQGLIANTVAGDSVAVWCAQDAGDTGISTLKEHIVTMTVGSIPGGAPNIAKAGARK